MRRRCSGRGGRSGAFTLIELLVVIAIIALLVSILLPALAQTRSLVKNTVEMSAGRELQRAYNMYATDFKDRLMIGFLSYSAGHNPHYMQPNDLGTPMQGWVIKRYPWRLMAWLDYDLRGMVNDKAMFRDFASRQRNNVTGDVYGQSVTDDAGHLEDMFSRYPSFGVNSVYVAGDYEYGSFQNPPYDNASQNVSSDKIPQGVADIRFTDTLQIFVTARAPVNLYSGTSTLPDVVPGCFRVFAPRCPTGGFGGGGGAGITFTGRWTANVWDPRRPPASYGYVDFRHLDGVAISTFFDGHVENSDFEQMRDARRWYNAARASNDFPVRFD